MASLTEGAMLLLAFGTAGFAYVLIRREILSRYRAENYAHEQRERCLATLTSIGDAVIVTDTKGTVVLLNPVAGRLTGWGDEALGKPLEDVFRIVNETTRHVIERQVQHMTRLVDDLLDISRISCGRITLQKAPVSIASVVAGAMETVRALTEARKQTVEILMPAEPGRVTGDETRLVQVLANLLHNAVKFTPEGGQIALTVSRLTQEGFMTVRDTGIGIPAEMLEQVFDLFTQLDASLERSQGGLGIGLTLVKNLVEMHGGTVQARSEGHHHMVKPIEFASLQDLLRHILQ